KLCHNSFTALCCAARAACLARLMRKAARVETTTTATNSKTTATVRPARTGLRRHQRAKLSTRVAGRATIVSPLDQDSRSWASARAEVYRRDGSFSRHFNEMVARSASTIELSFLGGTGACSTTWRIVSSALEAWKGGRPLSK